MGDTEWATADPAGLQTRIFFFHEITPNEKAG